MIVVAERTGSSATAGVPSALVHSTVQAATQFALTKAATAGMVSARAAALAEAFLRSLLMARIRNAALAAFVTLAIATVGAFALEPHGGKPLSQSDARQELIDLARTWAKAMVQSDVATVDRLMAYEMFGTDPVGAHWDKASYLERVKTNAFHFESCEFKESKVQVFGDAAVVAGDFLTNINSKGSPYREERSTSTWIRRHGSWQCVAWQSLFVPGSEPRTGTRHPAASTASKAVPF